MQNANYYLIASADVPASVRDYHYNVPGRCQGQIVEIGYSSGNEVADYDRGARFMRAEDRSFAPDDPARYTYYRRGRVRLPRE